MRYYRQNRCCKMENDVITIVSGLPRSGTSMMMKMLDEGGLEPLTDNVRTADKDNPKGYYEFERVKDLPEDTEWLDDAKGKAVKVLAEQIKHLPEGYNYKVIFMERNLEEIIESQRKMLIRQGKDPDKVSREELRDMFTKYRRILKNEISSHPDMEVIYVSYNDIMSHPEVSVDSIIAFHNGELDKDKMVNVIDEDLYRNRAE